MLHNLRQQMGIIEKYMIKYMNGVKCWHSRTGAQTTGHYVEFARKHGLLMPGGSDYHQEPVLLGTLDITDWVAI